MERIKKIVLTANGSPEFKIPELILNRYDLKEGDELELFEEDETTIVAKFKRN